MKNRVNRLLLIAVVLVGVGQLAFTIAVDPHVRCATTPEIASALDAEGLPPQEQCLTDATAYHLLGLELSETNRYERPFDRVLLGQHRPTAEYPPLYPFALSLLQRVGINSIGSLQAVLGTLNAMLSALAVGLLAKAIGLRRWWQFATVLAVGFQPLLLQAHALLMTESIFVALAGFIVLQTLRVAQKPSPVSASLLGLLLGAATLARGEGLLWLPIVVAVVAFAIARPISLSRRLTIGSVIIGIAVATMVPWTARNLARFDSLIPVSNNLGTVLDGANCDLTYYGAGIGSWRSTFVPGLIDRNSDCFEGFRIENPDFDEADATNTARAAGTQYAKGHAERLPVVAAARVGRSLGVFNSGQQINLEVLEGRDHLWQTIGTAVWWLTLPVSLVGLLLMLQRNKKQGLVLAMPWLAVIVTSVVTYGNQRFRVGLDAVAIVLALHAVHEMTIRPKSVEHQSSLADS